MFEFLRKWISYLLTHEICRKSVNALATKKQISVLKIFTQATHTRAFSRSKSYKIHDATLYTLSIYSNNRWLLKMNNIFRYILAGFFPTAEQER